MQRLSVLGLCLAAALAALPACESSSGANACGAAPCGLPDAGGDGGGDVPQLPMPTKHHPQVQGDSWTVLVYMMADNDLEPFALLDLAEMAEVGSTGNLNIVVQIDRAAGYSSDGVLDLGDFTTAKRLRVAQGKLEVIEDLGETATGDPAVLADFVSWGLTTFPADRHALIFWDHGAGWFGFGSDDASPDKDGLSFAEIDQALTAGLATAGVDDLSLIGFDACLMGSWETARTVAEHAEYMLASEELEPGHGWDYRALAKLRDDPSTDPVAFANALIEGFQAQALTYQTGANITLSLVDLYALPILDHAIAKLAEGLTSDVAILAPSIGQHLAQTIGFGRSPDPEQDMRHVDLGDLVARLAAANPSLLAVAANVEFAMDFYVLANVTGPAREGSRGVSVYFPPHRERYDTRYDALPKVDVWRAFLAAFYGAGDQVTETPDLAPVSETPVVWQDGLARIAGEIPPEQAASITDATLFVGVVQEDASVIFLADHPAQRVDATTFVGQWDAAAVVVVQGDTTAYAYASFTEEVGGFVGLTVPFAYQRPGASDLMTVLLHRSLNASTGEVAAETYYIYDELGIGELTPEPGALMAPMLQVAQSDGATSWQFLPDAVLDPTASLDLYASFLPEGTPLYLLLQITDFAGQTAALVGTTYVGGEAPQDPCGGVPATGSCQDDWIYWCSEDGTALLSANCADGGQTCGCVAEGCGCVVAEEPGETCGDVPATGVCDGDVVRWCDQASGIVQTNDCGTMGWSCVCDAGACGCDTPPPVDCEGLPPAGICTSDTVLTYCASFGPATIDCADWNELCVCDDAGQCGCLMPGEGQPCGDVPVTGVCTTATVVTACAEDGTTTMFDCAVNGNTCGCGDDGVCGCGLGVPAEGCGDLTFEGVCDGDIVRWCDGGTAKSLDCAPSGLTCGVDDGGFASCL